MPAPFEAALGGRLLEAVQQQEPLAWIKKLVDFNPKCVGAAFPAIVKIKPQPSFEVLKLLAENCPSESVPSALSSILMSNETPNIELVQLLVEKCPAALKQPCFNNCLPLICTCNYHPDDFEIIQYLVKKYPAACLRPGIFDSYAFEQRTWTTDENQLPLEILKKKKADKKIIDLITKETIDIECIFLEAVFACKHVTSNFFDTYLQSCSQEIQEFCLRGFGKAILRADGSLDSKTLLSKMNVKDIREILQQGGSHLFRSSPFQELMDQIQEVNKAKREFDEQTTMSFLNEPKSIMKYN